MESAWQDWSTAGLANSTSSPACGGFLAEPSRQPQPQQQQQQQQQDQALMTASHSQATLQPPPEALQRCSLADAALALMRQPNRVGVLTTGAAHQHTGLLSVPGGVHSRSEWRLSPESTSSPRHFITRSTGRLCGAEGEDERTPLLLSFTQPSSDDCCGDNMPVTGPGGRFLRKDDTVRSTGANSLQGAPFAVQSSSQQPPTQLRAGALSSLGKFPTIGPNSDEYPPGHDGQCSSRDGSPAALTADQRPMSSSANPLAQRSLVEDALSQQQTQAAAPEDTTTCRHLTRQCAVRKESTNAHPLLTADSGGGNKRQTRTGGAFDAVSTDLLRASGYQKPFKNLLSTRRADTTEDDDLSARSSKRDVREAQPAVAIHNSVKSDNNDEQGSLTSGVKCNGGLNFVSVDETSAAAVDKEGAPPTVRVIRRKASRYGIAISSESTAKMRCRIRKELFMKRIKLADVGFALALFGIALTIIDTEVTALSSITHVTKHSSVSIVLRCFIMLSTWILMAFVILYHAVEVKIALIDSGADDWRVAFTTERLIKLLIELSVCAICPLPVTGYFQWPIITLAIDASDVAHRYVWLPVDVPLSVPMFLRAYLLGRFMVLHSKQFQDAATRSIAALNRISMDFGFVVKTMMSEHPLRVLIVFTVAYWICMSWMFTQCERYGYVPLDDGTMPAEAGRDQSFGVTYFNSIWFVMVTFMSIGYGDVVPSTYCGRTLSIFTGIVGAGVSSALIAVMSRKLELSRAEKHVNNFVADSKLTNQRKNAAASVLQQTWFIHKYKTQKLQHHRKTDQIKVRIHQRKFLQAISEFRRIKWDQRKLADRGNSLLDIGKMHNEMHETLWEMHHTQDRLITQIDVLTQKVIDLQQLIAVQQQQSLYMQQQQLPQQQQQQLLQPNRLMITGDQQQQQPRNHMHVQMSVDSGNSLGPASSLHRPTAQLPHQQYSVDSAATTMGIPGVLGMHRHMGGGGIGGTSGSMPNQLATDNAQHGDNDSNDTRTQ